MQPCSSAKGKISLGLCGRFTLAELLSVTVSIGVRRSHDGDDDDDDDDDDDNDMIQLDDTGHRS